MQIAADLAISAPAEGSITYLFHAFCRIAIILSALGNPIVESFMRRNISALLLGFMLLISAGAFLSACNTVHGAGEDLEDSSNAVKKKM